VRSPKIRADWDTIKASYWFRPSLYVIASVCIAVALLQVDHVVALPRRSSSVWWFYTGTEQDAAVLLETIATAIMTVAGVTFSMTIAALTMASQTYGPRLLRGFMRDAGDQTVFGIFLGTFAYCIVVLRSLHNAKEVPILAVFFATLLALASVAALIFYIHHVTRSMEPESVIDSVGHDLDVCIDGLYPERSAAEHKGSDGRTEPDIAGIRDRGERIKSDAGGYVHVVDTNALVRLATRHDLTLLVTRQPGYYVVHEDTLAIGAPASRLTDEVRREVCRAFMLADRRNLVQDPEYGVNQLAEIVVHALSPGINNPFTAALGVDRFSQSLARLAMRDIPSPFRYDNGGALRVIAYPVTFVHLVEQGFGPIRHFASTSAVVYRRLIAAIASVAQHAFRDEDRACLRRELVRILDTAQANIKLAEDFESIRDEAHVAFAVIDAGENPPASVLTSTKER
jgi:uncharacterized membrane protein